tara:strand:- start:4284 stop:4565 length:282 start_codon:yes stop_codon:yes gene_type:complete
MGEIDKAEAQRHYGRGYAAGRKRLERDKRAEARLLDERQFWDEAFLSMSAEAFRAQGWKQGDTPITNLDQRVDLAADWADRAVKVRRKRLARL